MLVISWNGWFCGSEILGSRTSSCMWAFWLPRMIMVHGVVELVQSIGWFWIWCIGAVSMRWNELIFSPNIMDDENWIISQFVLSCCICCIAACETHSTNCHLWSVRAIFLFLSQNQSPIYVFSTIWIVYIKLKIAPSGTLALRNMSSFLSLLC